MRSTIIQHGRYISVELEVTYNKLRSTSTFGQTI